MVKGGSELAKALSEIEDEEMDEAEQGEDEMNEEEESEAS